MSALGGCNGCDVYGTSLNGNGYCADCVSEQIAANVNDPAALAAIESASTTRSMDALADALRTLGFTNAYVEHTGGGCATLYAGPTHEEAGWGTRYALIAGPGWFDAAWRAFFTIADDEFSYGPDNGGHVLEDYTFVKAGTEAEIAADMSTFIRSNGLDGVTQAEYDA